MLLHAHAHTIPAAYALLPAAMQSDAATAMLLAIGLALLGIAAISHVRLVGHEAAVVGAIVAVDVNAINFQSALPSICESPFNEGFRTFDPFVADANTSTSIPLVVFGCRVSAACFGALNDSVKRMVGVSVRPAPFGVGTRATTTSKTAFRYQGHAPAVGARAFKHSDTVGRTPRDNKSHVAALYLLAHRAIVAASADTPAVCKEIDSAAFVALAFKRNCGSGSRWGHVRSIYFTA
jgi:hypothetical protein